MGCRRRVKPPSAADNFMNLIYGPLIQLFYIILLALAICFLRYFVEKRYIRPLAISLGIRETCSCSPNLCKYTANILETAFSQSCIWTRETIDQVSEDTGMNEEQVKEWLERRRSHGKSSNICKFCESLWRFGFYTIICLFGLVVLLLKPWIWDIFECWTSSEISVDVKVYYLLSTAFAFSQLCKKNQCWPLLVHHTITFILLYLSWIFDFIRIGTLILILHDSIHIFLEGAKLALYLNQKKISDMLFGCFILVWIMTRLIIFPFWIIRHTLSYPIAASTVVYVSFNGLLVMLLLLHFFWTYCIVKFVNKARNTEEHNDILFVCKENDN